MQLMKCLEDIIGVTQSDCTCITASLNDDQKADVKKSTSGMYMDDLPGGVSMKGLNEVDTCQSFYQLATKARDNAIATMQNELVVAISNKYKKDKNAFIGQIGKPDFSQTLGVVKQVQGIRIRPADWSDAVIKISRIQLILNDVTLGLQVNIWKVPIDSIMGELVKSFTVDTVANAYVSIGTAPGDLPLSLPFVVGNQQFEYWITYDLTGRSAAPKNTGLQCISCNKGVSPFSDYVTVQGAQVDDQANLTGAIYDTYSHGFLIDVDIRCNNEQLFCREYSEDDAVAIVMATSSNFKAGELLIEYVLQSPDVNRYTTMSREYLWGKRNHFRKEFEDRILYLASSIDVTASGCYVCKEQSGQPFVQGILS